MTNDPIDASAALEAGVLGDMRENLCRELEKLPHPFGELVETGPRA